MFDWILFFSNVYTQNSIFVNDNVRGYMNRKTNTDSSYQMEIHVNIMYYQNQ